MGLIKDWTDMLKYWQTWVIISLSWIFGVSIDYYLTTHDLLTSMIYSLEVHLMVGGGFILIIWGIIKIGELEDGRKKKET